MLILLQSLAMLWYNGLSPQTLLIVPVTILLAVPVYYSLYLRRRKKELESMVVEQQLKALRAQVNPHFLQNTFEFLAQNIRFGDLESSLTVIHKIAGYFRIILERSDKSIVTLEDELESAEEYLSLKKMMLYDAFSYSIDVGDNVDTIGILLPSLLLQPLLENAVKYGVGKGLKKGSITIKVQQNDEFAFVYITDTGSSHRTDTMKKAGRHPKGIELTDTRLNLLFEGYKNKSAVEMSQLPDGGTMVMVKIPLIKTHKRRNRLA